MSPPLFRIIFSLIVAGELLSRILDNPLLHFICKPLIVISLSLFFYQQTRAAYSRFATWIQVGLVFSLAGDVFLMFDGVRPLYFPLGLASFLLAHIAYIIAYHLSSRHQPETSFVQKNPWSLVPFLAYGLSLYAWLFSRLGELKIPVFVYTLALLGMGIFALNRSGRCSAYSFRLIFSGAMLFIVSDSVLAVDKFIAAVPVSSVIIMTTYSLAQYLIVLGSVAHINEPRFQRN
ncbi:MAG: lysoplasmalogenase [Bacteroidota bacterium]